MLAVVYKAVVPDYNGEHLKGFYSIWAEGLAKRRYELGIVVHPIDGTHLFAFKEIPFRKHAYIYKCHAEVWRYTPERYDILTTLAAGSQVDEDQVRKEYDSFAMQLDTMQPPETMFDPDPEWALCRWLVPIRWVVYNGQKAGPGIKPFPTKVPKHGDTNRI